MKEMCTNIPKGSCPNCGHKQFIVYEQQQNAFITNQDGDIIDSKELSHTAVGKCIRCGQVFDMFSALNRFIPLTELRKILYDYSPYLENENKYIKNPMEE